MFEPIADKLQKLTVIALSTSGNDKPAFSGAVKLGMVQAFEDDKTTLGIGASRMGIKDASFEDLTQEVKRRNIFPNQLYSFKEIENDREFSSHFDQVKQYKSKLEELQTNYDQIKTEKTNLERKGQLSTLKNRLKNILNDPSRGLTDRQKLFIENGIDEDSIDLTDDGLKNFVDRETKSYFKRVAPDESNQTDIPTGQTNTNGSTGEIDYTKAENNPLLDEDL